MLRAYQRISGRINRPTLLDRWLHEVGAGDVGATSLTGWLLRLTEEDVELHHSLTNLGNKEYNRYRFKFRLLVADSSIGSIAHWITSTIAKNFRRLSKWHFQTKPLPAGNAGTNSPSPLASKSSSHLRDLPTNPSGVPNVEGLARVSREVTVTPTGLPERCIQPFAPSVARTQRFLSGPVATSRCTVAIASVG